MGMGSAQAINAAWLTAKMEDHKRPVALAAYVMSIQLANFPGNQLFRTKGTSIASTTSTPSTIAVGCGHIRRDADFVVRCAAVSAWADHCSFLRYSCCSCDFGLEGVVSIV